MALTIKTGMTMQVRPNFGMDTPIRVRISELAVSKHIRNSSAPTVESGEVPYRAAVENRVIFSYEIKGRTSWAYSEQVDFVWIDGNEVAVAGVMQ